MRQKVFWLHTTILAIVFVFSSSGQSRSALPAQPTKPAGFEYKFVPVSLGIDLNSGEALINEYDAQGWELIAVQSLTSSNGSHSLRFRGAPFWRDNAPSFKATNRTAGNANALRKADAIYIFKRPKVGP